MTNLIHEQSRRMSIIAATLPDKRCAVDYPDTDRMVDYDLAFGGTQFAIRKIINQVPGRAGNEAAATNSGQAPEDRPAAFRNAIPAGHYGRAKSYGAVRPSPVSLRAGCIIAAPVRCDGGSIRSVSSHV